MISFTFCVDIIQEGEDPLPLHWGVDAKDFNTALSKLNKFRKTNFKPDVMFKIKWFDIS